ncbi:MAG: hypothetical protein CMI32_08040 [Opitutales bacterium]|nr:hypothetical protein [Opitutales bacterium]
MSEGRFPEAEAILAKLKENDSPRICLRRSLLAYHHKDASGISFALKGISEKDLPTEERGWFHLMSGIGALGAKNRDSAQSHFDNAIKLAVGDAQQIEFLVLRYQAEITTGTPDEVLAVKLKQQWERFKDKSAGYDFAIEYANVLQALNRPNDAISVVESQLKVISGKQSDKRAHLLLTLGLLDQDPNSARGRDALEKLVERAEEPVLAKVGLRILASRFDPRKDNGSYVAFIDRLLGTVTPHPLRENLLLLRAHAALGFGEDDKVEEWSLRLMQEFPASPWKLDALRVLATTAWRTNPPKYRTVANYLNQIRATEEAVGQDFSETSLLMADCHFLAKDYENASSVYQNLLGQEFKLEIRSKALFQYVQSLIELGNLKQAAATLDNGDFGSKQLSSWWRAEWNLVAALKEREGADKAFARIRNTLEKSNGKMPEAATIRLTWLQAQLSLDLQEVETAPELTDKVMVMLEKNSSLDKDQFDMIQSQTLLTKGQALLRLKRAEESFGVFKILRTRYPESEQAALSYLLEANHHSAINHLAEAQRNLVILAERFPNSEYAPRALYEASINAERRGLPESLQEAVRLLEDMATRFPKSKLLFYARLKQGHLLRNLNDYEAALDVYEEILRNEIFAHNPDLPLASLSRADCLFAIARTEAAKLTEVAKGYSDLFTLNSLPIDLRVEAGFKRTLCLRKADKVLLAQAACWEVIHFFVESDDSLSKLGGKGRYWAARTIFELGEILDREGSSKQALEVYELIRRHGLPGGALATARGENGKN